MEKTNSPPTHTHTSNQIGFLNKTQSCPLAALRGTANQQRLRQPAVVSSEYPASCSTKGMGRPSPCNSTPCLWTQPIASMWLLMAALLVDCSGGAYDTCKTLFSLPGDFIIGGLFPVHSNTTWKSGVWEPEMPLCKE